MLRLSGSEAGYLASISAVFVTGRALRIMLAMMRHHGARPTRVPDRAIVKPDRRDVVNGSPFHMWNHQDPTSELIIDPVPGLARAAP